MPRNSKAITKKGRGASGALQKMAIQAAMQALAHVNPGAGTAIRGARMAYGAYKTLKRSAPQKSATKKKVVEKQLETQIAGGHGVTLHRKIIGRRLTKLPPSVKMQKEAIRNAREIYDQGNATSAVNQQSFGTLHTVMDYNDFVGLMGTNTPNASKKLFIESYITTFEFNNVTNAAIELTLYQHKATDPARDVDSPAARFKQGIDRKYGDTANVETKMFHRPDESGTLAKFFKCTYAKKVILSPGESCQFKIYNNINRTMKNDAFQGNDNTDFRYYAEGWTMAHSVMLRGFTIFEAVSGEGGRGVYSPTKVAWTAHKRIVFRTWDSGIPAQSYYTTNDLVPVTGVLKEVNQELGAGQTFINL